jgi:hypothetical protein
MSRVLRHPAASWILRFLVTFVAGALTLAVLVPFNLSPTANTIILFAAMSVAAVASFLWRTSLKA